MLEMSLFVQAIPYNFYAIFTIIMMVVIAVAKFDFGPMKLHEKNAMEKGDLFTSGTKVEADETAVNPKGKVTDLILPVVVLIICCVIGMIYSGEFFTGTGFIEAFSNSDASVGLVLGSAVAIVFAVAYLLIRRVISFKDAMASLPEGFKAMVPAILILTCAWTLKAMTDSLGAKIYISQLVEGSAGALQDREQQSRNESEVIELGNYFEVGNGRCVYIHSRQHFCDRYGKETGTPPV